ncbi:MAG: Uma2 family endonuclease [Blastocatellia bacterium]
MTTVLAPPEKMAEQAAQTVILHNVSWSLYQTLLAEHRDVGAPRFAYDRGTLEIHVPSFRHEHINRLLADIFRIVADELEIDFLDAGSTTFERDDLIQGVEPDTAFYIQHAPEVREREQINLSVDPAPDLIIEVAITSPSLNKFPILAGLGVPEIWRFHKNRVAILCLTDDGYAEQEQSGVLARITGAQLTQLIAESQQMKRTEWRARVRERARALKQDR